MKLSCLFIYYLAVYNLFCKYETIRFHAEKQVYSMKITIFQKKYVEQRPQVAKNHGKFLKNLYNLTQDIRKDIH